MITDYKGLRLIRYLSDEILPLLFWVTIMFGFDTPAVAVLTILSALLHELGHLSVVILRKIDFGFRAHMSGFRIREKSLSYIDHALILLGGPCANLVIYLVTLPFPTALDGYISLLGYINLATAITNLLPIEGYDGYGIVKCILEGRGLYRAVALLECVSFIAAVALTFIALYLLSRFNVGYWLFGLFFTIISVKIKEKLSTDRIFSKS